MEDEQQNKSKSKLTLSSNLKFPTSIHLKRNESSVKEV